MIPETIPEQEKFLYYLSALGTVDKSVFRQWFGELCLRSDAKEDLNISFLENRYIRVMQSLGHIDDSGGKLWVCPPVLSFIRKDPKPIALLSGACDSDLISTLDHIISTEFPQGEVLCVKQSQCVSSDTVLLFPDAFFIKNIGPDDLRDVARALGAGLQTEEAPPSIVSLAGGIDQMSQRLEWRKYREDEPINSINRVFSPHLLHFTGDREDGRDYRLVEYRFNYLYEYWIWDDTEKGAVVQRDWGRYMALNAEGVDVLIYDEDAGSLAVPTNVPLPVNLARAVTACSGLVPYEVWSGDLRGLGLHANNVPFDVYFGVPKDVGVSVAEKLGQRLVTVGGVFQPELCTL
ncbi:hypothetical protein Metli_0169 [Methanofollis liminatans DSM 4140]|uniref:Uncharacterized protein n=2 Tax=Methanofollis liminatans TaxID=2201 RepID=J1KZI5_9EURY|nr:hypothetical protein Metli_0169 [Methanofollis liminatans DSM 4140]